MNKIITLYVYELKKIVNRRIVWIVGLIMLSLSMFLSVSDLLSSSTYYGETAVSGYQAMKINRGNAKKFSGRTLDDDLLREMQENCKDESDEGTASKTFTSGGQAAITLGDSEGDSGGVMQEYFPIYSYVQQITEDRNLSLSINANELYETRKKEISQNRSDQMLTQEEYNYWNSKGSEISEPFVYEYTDGWSNLWEYAYTINYSNFPQGFRPRTLEK